MVQERKGGTAGAAAQVDNEWGRRQGREERAQEGVEKNRGERRQIIVTCIVGLEFFFEHQVGSGRQRIEIWSLEKRDNTKKGNDIRKVRKGVHEIQYQMPGTGKRESEKSDNALLPIDYTSPASANTSLIPPPSTTYSRSSPLQSKEIGWCKGRNGFNESFQSHPVDVFSSNGMSFVVGVVGGVSLCIAEEKWDQSDRNCY